MALKLPAVTLETRGSIKQLKSNHVCASMVVRSLRNFGQHPIDTIQPVISPANRLCLRNRPAWAIVDRALIFSPSDSDLDFTRPGRPDAQLERQQMQVFYIGVDEVGVGPLAGPIVAAAFWMRKRSTQLPGIRDSKQIKTRKRKHGDTIVIGMSLFYCFIVHVSMLPHRPVLYADRSEMKAAYDMLTESKEFEWAVAEVSSKELDTEFKGNSLAGRLCAMTRAVRILQNKLRAIVPSGRLPYWKVLVDGTHAPKQLAESSSRISLHTFVKGDDRICEISAASKSSMIDC
jgi:ribonuclease HII